MAEDFKDPRDVAWHPRRNASLVGHQAAERHLLQAHQSGSLHHAWLITGPKGIGKATLAYRFAKFLLTAPTPERARAHNSLYLAPEASAFRLVSAASHPDLLVIERGIDQRNKRLKSEISVETAREAQNFFARTSGAGGWRIAIVDSADELNGKSANALLKIIEEPPKQSIFLIVCHQPGRLLRTIRSRCLHLPLDPLGVDTHPAGPAWPASRGHRGGRAGAAAGRRTLERQSRPRHGPCWLQGSGGLRRLPAPPETHGIDGGRDRCGLHGPGKAGRLFHLLRLADWLDCRTGAGRRHSAGMATRWPPRMTTSTLPSARRMP